MKHLVNFELELRHHDYPGKLIAIEGIDGSGKTTQAHELVKKLSESGYPAVYTKEPTDSEIGKFIRQILAGEKEFEPFAFQYLFIADRVGHHQEIKKLLEEGKIVVSDRFFWSSVAYGGTDRGLDFSNDNNGDLLLSTFGILSPYHQFIAPDTTIYLKVEPQIAIERLSKVSHNADIYDKLPKLENVALGYNFLVKKFPEEFTVIDANKPINKVTDELFEKVVKITS